MVSVTDSLSRSLCVLVTASEWCECEIAYLYICSIGLHDTSIDLVRASMPNRHQSPVVSARLVHYSRLIRYDTKADGMASLSLI